MRGHGGHCKAMLARVVPPSHHNRAGSFSRHGLCGGVFLANMFYVYHISSHAILSRVHAETTYARGLRGKMWCGLSTRCKSGEN